jgi:DeoR/GlpR family transcriptional regulator of sugar metabolism
MNLEKLLTSGCRQKILKTLQKEKSLNIMGLVTKINSTYIEVNRNVKILEREGIISEHRYGRVRMIILNQEDPKTILLLQALKILNTQEKPFGIRKHNAENLQKSEAQTQEAK